MTILYTLYRSGLRLAELLALRLSDVRWDRNQLLVREDKVGKDSVVMLSQPPKAMLQRYFQAYQPQGWLFIGQDGESPYSARSVQAMVRACARRASIRRKVTAHTLHHCFAAYLLERGTDVRYIQELLSHKDIKATLPYTHVSDQPLRRIVSPFDGLWGSEKRKGGVGFLGV